MPLEIQVHALAIHFLAENPAQHADHLGALLINGCRIEIVDCTIGFRANGMGQRPGIFRELACPQANYVLDALDGTRAHVRREILVTEDRQAFLQAQLEPVPAGNPVAGPVVEVFVRDDALDGFEVCIGGRVLVRQHIGRVEDVQPLVLHGAEIEVADGHDVEHAQIIFPAICVLVPFHGTLQAVHRPGRAVGIALVDMDRQVDGPATHCGELVAMDVIVAGT